MVFLTFLSPALVSMVTKFSDLNNFNTLTGLHVSANSQMSQSSFTPSPAYRVLFNRTQTLQDLSSYHQLPPLHPPHHPVCQTYETTSLILGWPGSFTCVSSCKECLSLTSTMLLSYHKISPLL